MNEPARRTVAALAIAISLVSSGVVAGAATLAVDSTADDRNLGANGNCTLREAVIAANSDTAVDGCAAGNGADTILIPAGAYTLTIAGANEDAALTGDLDLTSDVTIQGAGSGSTTILGGALGHAGIDRVLHVLGTPAVTVRGITLRNGATSNFERGGGVLVAGGTLLIQDSVVRENQSRGDGAGLAIAVGASVTIERSAIVDNEANAVCIGSCDASSGGGVDNQGALTLVDSTVAHNVASSGFFAAAVGGGIRSSTSGGLTAVSSTIAGNRISGLIGTGPSGIHAAGSGVVHLRSSILADPCTGASFASDGHNIEAGNTCLLAAAGDLPGTNPGLGVALIERQGTWFFPLVSTSVAIDSGDAGTCSATDQLGVARPQDGDGNGTATCDRGAVELPPGPDTDGDGYRDGFDLCPLVADPGQEDRDHDGIGDACDPCTDADLDGYGDPASAACTQPALDCDDTDFDVSPGAPERLGNGVDDDCNPATLDCAPDLDGDGCSPTGGACGCRDCNDSNPAVHEGATEIPLNGIDDDCNPASIDCHDGDGDGYPDGYPNDWCYDLEIDCNDADPAVHPGAIEVPGNGKDDDCNASTPGGCQPRVAEASVGNGAKGSAPAGGADVILVTIALVGIRRILVRRRMA